MSFPLLLLIFFMSHKSKSTFNTRTQSYSAAMMNHDELISFRSLIDAAREDVGRYVIVGPSPRISVTLSLHGSRVVVPKSGCETWFPDKIFQILRLFLGRVRVGYAETPPDVWPKANFLCQVVSE